MLARTTLCATLALAAPALAETAPTYLPTRDVSVSYHVESQETGSQDIRARWSSSLGRARLDGGPGYLLVDPSTRRTTMVMEQQHLMMDLPGGAARSFLPDAAARFTRGRTATVAGYRCTVWTVTSDQGGGTACLTDDGVILRGRGTDRQRHAGSIEATSVQYGAQPAGLFAVPEGMRKFTIPKNLGDLANIR